MRHKITKGSHGTRQVRGDDGKIVTNLPNLNSKQPVPPPPKTPTGRSFPRGESNSFNQLNEVYKQATSSKVEPKRVTVHKIFAGMSDSAVDNFLFVTNLRFNPTETPILPSPKIYVQVQKTPGGKMQTVKKGTRAGTKFVSHDGSMQVCVNSEGQLHCVDEPAIKHLGGSEEWWVNGVPHRLDGPAKTWENGTAEWYVNGYSMQIHGHNPIFFKLLKENFYHLCVSADRATRVQALSNPLCPQQWKLASKLKYS